MDMNIEIDTIYIFDTTNKYSYLTNYGSIQNSVKIRATNAICTMKNIGMP